jgi:hypothetical protein
MTDHAKGRQGRALDEMPWWLSAFAALAGIGGPMHAERVCRCSDRIGTRREHEMDTHSVPMGVWLYRRIAPHCAVVTHRRAIVVTTPGRRSGRPRTVLVQVFKDGSALLVVAKPWPAATAGRRFQPSGLTVCRRRAGWSAAFR